jgi:hypothetical protein
MQDRSELAGIQMTPPAFRLVTVQRAQRRAFRTGPLHPCVMRQVNIPPRPASNPARPGPPSTAPESLKPVSKDLCPALTHYPARPLKCPMRPARCRRVS